jgi:hypothetical protein
MVVSGDFTEGAMVIVGEAVTVGASVGAGDAVGTKEMDGSADSAAVGAALGAGLEVGDAVMLQSAFSMVEEMSGMVKVSFVQSPLTQVNPSEQALFMPMDSSGSQIPMGSGSPSHMRNSWIP